jgi:hypothetical protein
MRRWVKVLNYATSHGGALAMIARTLAFAVIVGLSVPADAADHPVNSESDLRTAITSAVDGDTITFNVDVTLTQDLPAIQTNVTILGNNRIVDGANRFRGFFVGKFTGAAGTPAALTVSLQNLTIRNAQARGGAGKDNAGGGAGLGGALFVANLATVTMSNLQFDTNSALGGLGGVAGIYGGGGGGGLGGFAGSGTGGGGGGVGRDASGGNGGVGVPGSAGIVVGPAFGGNGGGNVGGGSNGGGGGGGSSSPSFVIFGGGGGGVGGGPGLTAGPGGDGGFGGGGGGAGDNSSVGGKGGFGGGGGASGVNGGSVSGVGGFGGGGAGGVAGGFGGGGGAISIGFPGGGGGAGLGGALFVQEGGSLTLAGPLTINGSTVAGGAVFDTGAAVGSAFGSGIFLQGNGGPLTFTPGVGETQTVANDIADQTGSGGTGRWGLTKSGAGTLTLAGVNTYSGATTVSAGTLLVNSPGSIVSPVTVQSGGTLGGTGTISNTVSVNSGGTIAPGTSPGILNTGSLTLTAGGTLAVEINGATAGTQYDQVNVAGGVALGNATLNVVLGFTPSAGQTFTIIANDLSDAVVGTFSGLPEGGIFTAGAGRFRVSYVGGSGNDVTLTAIAPPTIDKAFGASAIPLNATTTLTFKLTNPDSGTALTGVGFTDTLPSGLTVANGATPTCGGTLTTSGGNTIALAGATIASSATCMFSVTVTGTSAGLKPNTTSAVTSTEGGTGGTAVAFLVVVNPPEVAPPTIAKAFGAASIIVSGTTMLTITLTNPNPVTALSGVGFTDALPAGLVVATPNGLANTCGGTVAATAGTASVALVNGGLLANNGTCTVTVNVAGTTGGAKNNTTGAVTSTEGGAGGTASASLAVIAPPTIAKAFGAASIIVNGTTTLTFTLTNPNTGTALTGVGFTDPLPAGVVVATPNALANACGGAVTAVAGTGGVGLVSGALPANGSCTIKVDVTGMTGGAKNNTTGVVTSTEGGAGGTASASLTVIAPPTIAKAFGAASIIVNGTTTLAFTLTNPNTGTALTGVGFTDTLPAGVVVATPNGLANTCGGTVVADPGKVVPDTGVPGTGSVGLVSGALPANGSCTIKVDVTGMTGGVKNNITSAVTSTEGGAGVTASASLTVEAVVPPTVAKVFGAASIAVNGTTTLTFTLTNPNAATALTSVGFTDALPAGLVVATPNGLAGSCGGGTITAAARATTVSLAGATLAAATSCAFTINVLAIANGAQNNTTSAVTSANGGAGNAASASLNVLSAVVAPTQIPTLSTFALAFLAIVVLLSGLRRKPAA